MKTFPGGSFLHGYNPGYLKQKLNNRNMKTSVSVKTVKELSAKYNMEFLDECALIAALNLQYCEGFRDALTTETVEHFCNCGELVPSQGDMCTSCANEMYSNLPFDMINPNEEEEDDSIMYSI